MHPTILIIASITTYEVQCNRINQNVHISGLEESDFAVYRKMNEKNAIITEYPKERFTKVQLLESPYTECFVPNDNLKPIPSLKKTSGDVRGLIARYLGSGTNTPFRLTNRENNAAVSNARDIIREDDLRAINRDYRKLIEESKFTAEIILDSFEWIPLRLATPKGRSPGTQFQLVAKYRADCHFSGLRRGTFDDDSNAYLVIKGMKHETLATVPVDLQCPCGHCYVLNFRYGTLHGAYQYGRRGDYIECALWGSDRE